MSIVSLLCKDTICFRKSILWVGKIGTLAFAEALTCAVGAKANVG